MTAKKKPTANHSRRVIKTSQVLRVELTQEEFLAYGRVAQIAQFAYRDGVAMEMCPRVLTALSLAGLIEPFGDFRGRVLSYRQTESGAKALAERGVVA